MNKLRHKQEAAKLAASGQLIITVKEARKLLGKDFKGLDDKQIEDIVTKLDLLAQGFIAKSVST